MLRVDNMGIWLNLIFEIFIYFVIVFLFLFVSCEYKLLLLNFYKDRKMKRGKKCGIMWIIL